MSMIIPVFIGLMTGCVVVDKPFQETYSSDGVSAVVADVDSGNFEYSGGLAGDFLVNGTSRGTGSRRKRAEERADNNVWSITETGGALVMQTTSWDRGSVNFDVRGPEVMDLDVVADNGRVEIDSVQGIHKVTASGAIYGDDIVGDVDFLSSNGSINVEVFPYSQGVLYIEARSGSVNLALPGGPAFNYDIEVWGDPDYEMSATDLGFDAFYLNDGYMSAERGYADIEVKVYVTGGSFSLTEAY